MCEHAPRGRPDQENVALAGHIFCFFFNRYRWDGLELGVERAQTFVRDTLSLLFNVQ